MEETISRSSLLIETPTSMRRPEPEVVWEMERMSVLVVPEETASTTALGVSVGVSGNGVFVDVGGTGVSVGVEVSVGGDGVFVDVGGTGVSVGVGVSVGGDGVFVDVGGPGVSVDVGVSVGGNGVFVGVGAPKLDSCHPRSGAAAKYAVGGRSRTVSLFHTKLAVPASIAGLPS